MLSCNGMNTFRWHIKVLQYLFDCWSQDTDVVVCAALDDSDIDMPAGDSVTDDAAESDADDAERDADEHGLPDPNEETETVLDSARNGQSGEITARLDDEIEETERDHHGDECRP